MDTTLEKYKNTLKFKNYSINTIDIYTHYVDQFLKITNLVTTTILGCF